MSKWSAPIFERLLPCFEYLKEEGWTPGVAKDKTVKKVLYVEDCSEEAPCLFMTETEFNEFVRAKGDVDFVHLFYSVRDDGDIATLHEALEIAGLGHSWMRYNSHKSPWSRTPNGYVAAHGHPLIRIKWEGVM